ncbi:DNA methyltransferase [uncultured Thiodictyon sp.]|uniref:DNA modification methylase n=1 Tax=uncultured Thiodictyon sp. TaxID=1846217 RepID=UPI0025DB6882|nr:DNA methyltransferase [uncultured Thiodictyon sp.]
MSSDVLGDQAALEHWPLERFIEYIRNPRVNDHAVAQVAAAIHEFGFRVPIVAKSDGLVVDGHLRLKAARKLGLETVPVLLADDLTDTQVRAFRLSVNKLAELADWDDELLRLELEGLQELGFDLDLLGFDADEIGTLLHEPESDGTAGLTDPEDTPALHEIAITQPGDVWCLGPHRLVCGDSTDPGAVAAALNGATPHVMVTDPPYGVEYDAAWRNRALRADGTAVAGRAVGKVANDTRADWREAWALYTGDVAYVWHADRHSPEVAESLVACGFILRNLIIWGKNNLVIGRGDYHHKHEPAWYCVRQGGASHWQGDRTQTTLWDIDKPRKSETGHSTQKPVECMARPIRNNSAPGEAVYEPFSGSGTTIIACTMEGRVCHAIELMPAYVDMAVRRWQAFTGRSATLDATAEPFPEAPAVRDAA